MQRPRTAAERDRLLEELKRKFFGKLLIEHKYVIQQVIGEGSYGVVCSAIDRETNQRVAVKRIMRVFEEAPEATRTLRELKFLRLLRDHENIITIKDVLLPSERDRFDDVFVVLELMPTDLTRVLRSSIELSNEHIRWLVYQLLRGIHYLHSAKVYHRDLKPSNILLNAACDLRIIDFGLARLLLANTPDSPLFTDYVATRWYRAPELIVSGSTQYTTAIDMWSVGCIFGEMLNSGRPLFPGINNTNQLERILEVCGCPPDHMASTMRSAPVLAPLLARAANAPSAATSLRRLLPASEEHALHLLARMLDLDPERRISAREAMEHPYFESLHDPASVHTREEIPAHEFEFETHPLNVEELRILFLEEILRYHPERRDQYLPRAQTRGYESVGQAARFRNDMIAVQSGIEPPRPWDSMPNQTLSSYFGALGKTGSNSGTMTAMPKEGNGEKCTVVVKEARAAALDDGSREDENHQMVYGRLASVESASSARGVRCASENVESFMETEVDN